MNASFRLRRRLFVGLTGLILSSEIPAGAQLAPVPPPACKTLIEDTKGGAVNLADPSQSVLCFWQFALHDPLSDALRTAAAAQKGISTVQTGAPTTSPGTTSAVSKPNTLTSLATEYGGITSSTSNQTMTLQTTLDGIPRALVNRGKLPFCWSELVNIEGCAKAGTLNLLNRFGLGVTANTSTPTQNLTGSATGASQGTTQPVSVSSSGETKPSFSSAFAKFTLIRAAYKFPTKAPSEKAVVEAQEGIIKLLKQGQSPPAIYQEYHRWQTYLNSALDGPTFAQLPQSAKYEFFARCYSQIVGILFENKTFSECTNSPIITVVPKLPATPTNPRQAKWQQDLIDAINNYMAAASLYRANFDQTMLNALNKPVLALEYDFDTPQNQPTNSTMKLVYGQSFGKPKCRGSGSSAENSKNQITNPWTVTVNGGASLYNSTPPSSIPGASDLRNVQAGAEVDYAVCTSDYLGSWFGNSTFALAYYYQDQTSPSILKVTPGMPLAGISFTGLDSSTNQVFTKKGPINVAQFKYGWGVGKNVSFPIAVTWSNRTELITRAIWGLQFGVSYDLSSLMGSAANGAGSAPK
jgi:hypothetical protein